MPAALLGILKAAWPYLAMAIVPQLASGALSKFSKAPGLAYTGKAKTPPANPYTSTGALKPGFVTTPGNIPYGANKYFFGPLATLTSTVAPYAGMLLGRGTQAASMAAGAGMQALGNLPARLAADTRPTARQEAVYGKVPGTGLADAISDITGAGGQAIAGVGNALGATVGDISSNFAMMNLQNRAWQNALRQGQDIHGLHLTPGELQVIRMQMYNQGQHSGGRP